MLRDVAGIPNVKALDSALLAGLRPGPEVIKQCYRNLYNVVGSGKHPSVATGNVGAHANANLDETIEAEEY